VIAWDYAVHATKCSGCNVRIGQGERVLRVAIDGVKKLRFYCEDKCGPAMIKSSLPPSPAEDATDAPQADCPATPEPAAAPVTEPRRRRVDPEPFDSIAAMAARFEKRPQSKERLA
jgi:hypothetical protein